MKRLRIVLVVVPALACAVSMAFEGCTKEQPPVVFDYNNPGGPGPVISSVDPPSALGGITQVTLTGKNFSNVDSANVVYFGTVLGKVISSTPTSIVVVPPDLDKSGYMIKVSVPGAFNLATWGPYTVEHAGIEYGGFADIDEVYSIGMDASENLYAQVKALPNDTSRVFKVTPSGLKTLFGTMIDENLNPWLKASDIKPGPGGYLYLQQTSNARFYRVAPGGGYTQVFTMWPGGGRASAFDFDSSGNVFAAGSGFGMFVLNKDGTSRVVGSYSGMTVKAIRVYAGYVYAAVSSPAQGVWKNRILDAQGNLDVAVQVFDWTKAPGTFPASNVLALTIGADGTLYVGCDNADPILTLPPGGTPVALYPGVLMPPAVQLSWGSGNYLYCNRYLINDPPHRRIIRIAMGKKGAPNYGWQ